MTIAVIDLDLLLVAVNFGQDKFDEQMSRPNTFQDSRDIHIDAPEFCRVSTLKSVFKFSKHNDISIVMQDYSMPPIVCLLYVRLIVDATTITNGQ